MATPPPKMVPPERRTTQLAKMMLPEMHLCDRFLAEMMLYLLGSDGKDASLAGSDCKDDTPLGASSLASGWPKVHLGMHLLRTTRFQRYRNDASSLLPSRNHLFCGLTAAKTSLSLSSKKSRSAGPRAAPARKCSGRPCSARPSPPDVRSASRSERSPLPRASPGWRSPASDSRRRSSGPTGSPPHSARTPGPDSGGARLGWWYAIGSAPKSEGTAND